MNATVDAAQLRLALNACLKVVTNDTTRVYGNKARAMLDNTALVFEAVDGYRLIRRRVLLSHIDLEAGAVGYMTRSHIQSILPLLPKQGEYTLQLEDDGETWPDTDKIIPPRNGGIKLSVKYLKEAMQSFPDVQYVTIDMTDAMKPIRVSPDERDSPDQANDVVIIMPAV